MSAQHKGHVFSHVIGNTVYIPIIFFSYEANLLRNKMEIIPTEIMKDHRKFKIFGTNPQPQITVLMGRSSLFTSNVAMISNSNFILRICKFLTTYMALNGGTKILFLIITHY